jgi:hypothetical protein
MVDVHLQIIHTLLLIKKTLALNGLRILYNILLKLFFSNLMVIIEIMPVLSYIYWCSQPSQASPRIQSNAMKPSPTNTSYLTMSAENYDQLIPTCDNIVLGDQKMAMCLTPLKKTSKLKTNNRNIQ